MNRNSDTTHVLQSSLELPCGAIIKNRLAKSAMSDSLGNGEGDPAFPKFESPPRGGMTAWYTMRLTALAEDRENEFTLDLPSAIRIYEERDQERCIKWRMKFFE
jgi:hypothetical protein